MKYKKINYKDKNQGLKHLGDKQRWQMPDCHISPSNSMIIMLCTCIIYFPGVKDFACPECEACFATKNTMLQHLVTHSQSRPYLCDECGFSTKFQSHLTAHKRIHTGNFAIVRKPQNDVYTQRRHRSACTSAQSDQSSLSA